MECFGDNLKPSQVWDSAFPQDLPMTWIVDGSDLSAAKAIMQLCMALSDEDSG